MYKTGSEIYVDFLAQLLYYNCLRIIRSDKVKNVVRFFKHFRPFFDLNGGLKSFLGFASVLFDKSRVVFIFQDSKSFYNL